MSQQRVALSKAKISFEYMERMFLTEIDYHDYFDSGIYTVEIKDPANELILIELSISAARAVTKIVEHRGTRSKVDHKEQAEEQKKLKVYPARDITP